MVFCVLYHDLLKKTPFYGIIKKTRSGVIIMNFLNTHHFVVGTDAETQFKRAEGIRQDGTMAMYRDIAGKLFVIAGHSNSGQIAMF